MRKNIADQKQLQLGWTAQRRRRTAGGASDVNLASGRCATLFRRNRLRTATPCASAASTHYPASRGMCRTSPQAVDSAGGSAGVSWSLGSSFQPHYPISISVLRGRLALRPAARGTTPSVLCLYSLDSAGLAQLEAYRLQEAEDEVDGLHHDLLEAPAAPAAARAAISRRHLLYFIRGKKGRKRGERERKRGRMR